MTTIGRPANRPHLWLILGASAITCAAFIARASFLADGRITFSLFDDAMVSMRYAANLASGHGLVWNPGGPRVEGYSNFLWTLWMALLHAVPVPTRLMSLLVSASGAALIVATAAMASRIAARLSGERDGAASTIAAALVGLCYPLLFWTLRGMEVGLIAFLIAVSIDLAMRIGDGEESAAGRLAVCLALLALTRPDGLVPALVIAVCTAAAAPSGRWRTLMLLCAAPIGAIGCHTLWRVSYYGEWLPNTYYLKMTGVPLATRLGRGAEAAAGAFSMYLWPAFAFAVAAAHTYWRLDRALVILVPATLAAYSVYVGGDAWEWMPYPNRYITPGFAVLLPAVAVALTSRAMSTRRIIAVIATACSGWELREAWQSNYPDELMLHGLAGVVAGVAALVSFSDVPARAAAVVVALWVFTSTSVPGYVGWLRTGGAHVDDDATASRVGLLIKQTTTADARIAVVWAGAVPYFAEREAIDLLGKNDVRIAKMNPVLAFYPGHNKFDYAYSIGELRPDLVLQLWKGSPETHDWISGQGYDRLTGEVFVRRDSTSVDRARLAPALPAKLP